MTNKQKQERPFKENRTYRGIAFSGSGFKTIDDFLQLFPKNKIKKQDNVASIKGFEAYHVLYFSEAEFTQSDKLVAEPKKGKKKKGKKIPDVYAYDMYIASIKLKRDVLFFVAVPFTKMAQVVFGTIHQKTTGGSRRYQVVRLEKLVKKINESTDSDDFFSATGVVFEIHGDEDTDRVILQGSEVLNGNLYQMAITQSKIYKSKLIKLIPLKAKIRFEGAPAETLVVDSDNDGNYRFRVRTNARNLAWFDGFFSQLILSDVVEATSAFPMRASAIEDEGESID